MPEQDFFERMTPEFAEHANSARENAQRQADVERLIATAEYEYVKMRRELAGLLPIPVDASADQQPALPVDQVSSAELTADAPASPPPRQLNEAA